MSVNRAFLLSVSEILGWLVAGTTVLAGELLSGERVIAIGWPMLLGFVWVVTRLYAVPVLDDVWAYFGVAVLTCLASILYLAWGSQIGLINLLLLRAQTEIALSVLSASYGALAGCLIGFRVVRASVVVLEAGFIEEVDRVDSAPYGTHRSEFIIAMALLVAIAAVDLAIR